MHHVWLNATPIRLDTLGCNGNHIAVFRINR